MRHLNPEVQGITTFFGRVKNPNNCNKFTSVCPALGRDMGKHQKNWTMKQNGALLKHLESWFRLSDIVLFLVLTHKKLFVSFGNQNSKKSYMGSPRDPIYGTILGTLLSNIYMLYIHPLTQIIITDKISYHN